MIMQRLPDDIPGREALIKAGFVNYAVLRNHRTIQTIRGIDKQTAEKIKEYIQGKKDRDKSTDYTISALRKMDLSDKDESFFEGDDRSSIDQVK
jgi:Holliday junction resolvasome RuvABC DNA-binding subunit